LYDVSVILDLTKQWSHPILIYSVRKMLQKVVWKDMHSEVIMNFGDCQRITWFVYLLRGRVGASEARQNSGLPHLPVRDTAAVHTPITSDAVTQPRLPVQKRVIKTVTPLFLFSVGLHFTGVYIRVV